MNRLRLSGLLRHFGLASSLILASCSRQSAEPEPSRAALEASGPGAWEVACVAPDSVGAADDSASALLVEMVTVWTSERRAFRAYQRVFCDDCAMFEASAPQFFASSTNLVNRTAERFPLSPTVACAQGIMHYRNASLGEGRFDTRILDEAELAFRRALTLNPPADLAQRIRSDLADLEAMRPRP